MEFNGTLNGVNVTAMWAGQDRQERCACAGRAGSLSTWHVLASSTQQAALCTQPARSEKLRRKGSEDAMSERLNPSDLQAIVESVVKTLQNRTARAPARHTPAKRAPATRRVSNKITVA